jgi:hypothetical protein
MELEALFNAVIVKPVEEEETQYGSYTRRKKHINK